METVIAKRHIFTCDANIPNDDIDITNISHVKQYHQYLVQNPDYHIKCINRQVETFLNNFVNNGENIRNIVSKFNSIEKYNEDRKKKLEYVKNQCERLLNDDSQSKQYQNTCQQQIILCKTILYTNKNELKPKSLIDFLVSELQNIIYTQFNIISYECHLHKYSEIIEYIDKIIFDSLVKCDNLGDSMCKNIETFEYYKNKNHKYSDFVAKYVFKFIDFIVGTQFSNYGPVDVERIERAVLICDLYDINFVQICNASQLINVSNVVDFHKYYSEKNDDSCKKFISWLNNVIVSYFEEVVAQCDTNDINTLIKHCKIYSLVKQSYNFKERNDDFMKAFINHNISHENARFYSVLNYDFPKFISDNFQYYLDNVSKVDNILNVVNFSDIDDFTSKIRTWKLSKSFNDEYQTCVVNVSPLIKTFGSYLNEVDFGLDRSVVTLDINEKHRVSPRIHIDAFVPILRPYISSIYGFCNKKFDGGESTINPDKTTITFSCNNIVFEESLFVANIMLTIGQLCNPSIQNVLHLINYNDKMTVVLNDLIKDGKVLVNNNILSLKSNDSIAQKVKEPEANNDDHLLKFVCKITKTLKQSTSGYTRKEIVKTLEKEQFYMELKKISRSNNVKNALDYAIKQGVIVFNNPIYMYKM